MSIGLLLGLEIQSLLYFGNMTVVQIMTWGVLTNGTNYPLVFLFEYVRTLEVFRHSSSNQQNNTADTPKIKSSLMVMYASVKSRISSMVADIANNTGTGSKVIMSKSGGYFLFINIQPRQSVNRQGTT